MGCTSKRCAIVISAFFGYAGLAMLKSNADPITLQSLLYSDYSSAFIAYTVGWLASCVGGIFVTKYGGATMFGLSVGIGAFVNSLIIMASKISPVWVTIVQCINGFVHAIAFCAGSDLWARWAPKDERCRFVARSFVGLYFGATIYWLLLLILQKIVLFYLIGGIALVWSLWWVHFVKNDPDDDTSLSAKEKQHLAENVDIVDKERRDVSTYPWGSIFTSKPLWILCVTGLIFGIGDTFAVHVVVTADEKSSFVSALFKDTTAVVAFIAMKNYTLVGFLSDRKKFQKKFSSTQIRKFFICVGFIIGALSLPLYLYVDFLNLAFYCSMFLFSKAFIEMAFLVNIIDLSPTYSGTLCGIQRAFIYSGNTLAILFKEKVPEPVESDRYHLICALYLFGALIYYLWGSSELQSWDRPRKDEQELKTTTV